MEVIRPVAVYPAGEYSTDTDLRAWIGDNAEYFRSALGGTSISHVMDRFGVSIRKEGSLYTARLGIYFRNQQSWGHDRNTVAWSLVIEQCPDTTSQGYCTEIDVLPEGMGVIFRHRYNKTLQHEARISSDFQLHTSIKGL